MNKTEIAAVLTEIGTLLELKGENPFKIRAYQSGARLLEGLAEDEIARRVAHAIGFEGGLVFTLVPLFAWWFGVSLWHAFVMDLGLIVFFLGYTFVFNWVFDHLFGLPASAMAAS